jgi:hypothetical protein
VKADWQDSYPKLMPAWRVKHTADHRAGTQTRHFAPRDAHGRSICEVAEVVVFPNALVGQEHDLTAVCADR